MKQTLIALEMSCNHCKMTIENAVKSLPGINHVNADPNTKKVDLDFNENITTIEKIKHAIEEAGYEVK